MTTAGLLALVRGMLEIAWSVFTDLKIAGLPLIVWLVGIGALSLILNFIRGKKESGGDK